ncbi:STY0301 family protein [uncultured Legionella sp.]|uniref:STY0301 family protein n=1 Tax=uncultured Legionella sp. TaxID=210934 RepID=UPI0026022ED8|nr:STY0301 family protein [uncultured Legionella sp.]
MSIHRLLAGLFFLGFSALLRAEIYIAHCPDTISTVEHIKETPKGWEVLNTSENNYLSTVSFYSDHPDKMASLKPEFSNKKQAKWEFSPQELIYLVCHYNHSAIKLTQPLPAKTVKCSVIYNQNLMGNNGFLPEKIECTK